MPPAPGWLSTTMGAPSAFCSAPAAARVIVSTPEAAATGRMKWIGCCADAVAAARHATANAARAQAVSTLRRSGRGRVGRVGRMNLSGWGLAGDHLAGDE